MKTVLITGASRGIGRAIANEFASKGYFVIINFKSNIEKAQELQNEIIENNGKCELSQFDIKDKEEVSNKINELIKKHKFIDILVNNAAITSDNLFIKMKENDWNSVIDTNLNSLFYITKHIIKKMCSKKSGRIINITSIAGQSGNIGQVNYSAAKAGVIGFTKSLAKEVGRWGITVNAVSPGVINTDMLQELSMDEIKKQIPLNRLGEAKDVAKLVSFLASSDASYITGQVIGVNGGLYM